VKVALPRNRDEGQKLRLEEPFNATKGGCEEGIFQAAATTLAHLAPALRRVAAANLS